jgi:hypothetical protein
LRRSGEARSRNLNWHSIRRKRTRQAYERNAQTRRAIAKRRLPRCNLGFNYWSSVMSKFGIRPGLVSTMRGVLEGKMGSPAAKTPARQSPLSRNAGGPLNGLTTSNLRAGPGDSSLRRAALPGMTRDLGDQALSTVAHAAADALPPGHGSTALHALGDTIKPSALGSGDPTTQMAAMQNDFLRQQAEMTRLNNKNTLASAVNQQSQELTSSLASVGNKGVSNIAKAASGQ